MKDIYELIFQIVHKAAISLIHVHVYGHFIDRNFFIVAYVFHQDVFSVESESVVSWSRYLTFYNTAILFAIAELDTDSSFNRNLHAGARGSFYLAHTNNIHHPKD